MDQHELAAALQRTIAASSRACGGGGVPTCLANNVLTAMSQRNIAAWASRTFLGLAIVVGIAGIVILLTFPIKV